METSVRRFFERYERFFNRSLDDDTDMDEIVDRRIRCAYRRRPLPPLRAE